MKVNVGVGVADQQLSVKPEEEVLMVSEFAYFSKYMYQLSIIFGWVIQKLIYTQYVKKGFIR